MSWCQTELMVVILFDSKPQDDIANDKTLVVDDISVELLPMQCDEIIMNNDMELGHYRFWDP